jgi:hypothetical protein
MISAAPLESQLASGVRTAKHDDYLATYLG